MSLPLISDQLVKGTGASNFFASQWEQAREDRLMPRRSDLTARRLVPILPVLTIYEYRSPEEVIVRLCGSRFCQLVNINMTGKNLMDLAIGEHRRRKRIERWRNLASFPCGGLTKIALPQPGGFSYQCDAIFLPVAPDDDRAPLQFMSVLEELAPGEPTPEIQNFLQQQVQTYPDEFLYIDIGRGAPQGEPRVQ